MDFSELTKQAVKAALKAGGVIRSFQDREVEWGLDKIASVEMQ